MTELSDNDKQRIKQEAKIYSSHMIEPSNITTNWAVTFFMYGAEYATRYEREQQAKGIEDVKERLEKGHSKPCLK